MQLAALVLSALLTWPAYAERGPALELADGVTCEACGGALVTVDDRNRYDGPVYEFDDCEGARHVHSLGWTSTTYRCACGRLWTVYVDGLPCPTCGFTRSNPGAYTDPCATSEVGP